MAKLKVQEAAKELSTNAGVLLENLSRVKKSANETLQFLKRIEGQFLKQEEKRKEEARLEAQRQLLERQRTAWIMTDPEEAALIAQAEAIESAIAATTAPSNAVEITRTSESPAASIAPPDIAEAATASVVEEKPPAASTQETVPTQGSAPAESPTVQATPETPTLPSVAPVSAEAPQAAATSTADAKPAAQGGQIAGPGRVRGAAPSRSGASGAELPSNMNQNQRKPLRGQAATPPAAQREPAGSENGQQRGQFITRQPMRPPTAQPRDGQTPPPAGYPLRPGIQGRPLQPQPPRPLAAQGQPGQIPQQGPRPFAPGQQTPRPVGGQGQFAPRPFMPQQGPRPLPPQGQQGQRPFTPGARPFGAQGQQGQRPFTPGAPRPGMPGARPFAPGAPRPGGAPGGRPQFGAPRPGGAAGARRGPELTPSVEKERVSNYDPNKKMYQRQHDPERVARNRKQLARDAGMGIHEDDVVRGGRRGRKRAPSAQQLMEPIRIEKAYMTAETITVKDLTERIGKSAGEIMKKLLLLGTMATINQELDFDTAQLVCSEFGVTLEMKLDKTAEDILSEEGHNDTEEDLIERSPVVTIMGHVDHGKTTLLDYIRKTRVAAGEAGGITQHIGAYTVELDGRRITFLDTPGHEAFTAMRARGAMATDIAVLVVAADDGVMPQTLEAISHARSANVPIIVAITKIDKFNANVDRIRQDLTNRGLMPEEWGGDTIMTPVSAVTGENVSTLLEMILLVADVQQLRANPNRRARGVIIEARLDKGRGPVATALVQNGTLHVGDMVVAGMSYGRVRAMLNDRSQRVEEAGPSTPVEIIGFGEVPDAGDEVSAVEDDKLSRMVAEERKNRVRAALVKSSSKVSLDDLFTQISEGQVKDLNLIVKADVQGSVEAVKQSLERLNMDEVRVRVIHGGVGSITENDVMLATTANAIIIGFNVRPDSGASDLAKRENIDVRLYRVIYDAINDVEKAMKGLLAPQFKEVSLGRAQVRMTFRVTGVGTIAGCYVTEGKIVRNAMIRLLRDNVTVFEGKISSLKHLKDDAREIQQGFECGVGLERYNDMKEGDVIECYTQEEVVR
ncbi:MAG: translation initiation factor IF-2 [Oscillospiraceae bacterium]|jgi:translation initiation factor IF-2|nr:translation initiation factor IF-2 [Oscillospiraceae bacterium]